MTRAADAFGVRGILATVSATLLVSGCGGGENTTPATSQEILQDIATCLEQSGAHVTVKAETSSLEAYWGSDPADLDRVVGVSTSSYVEKDGGRVYYPATLTRDLPPEDAEALDDCVAKWEI